MKSEGQNINIVWISLCNTPFRFWHTRLLVGPFNNCYGNCCQREEKNV